MRVVTLALAMLLAAGQLAAQVGQAPPRDRSPGPRVGTGAIKGRVVDALAGGPVSRVAVRVNGPGGPRQATTDESGAFAVTQLPAGPVMLTADKSTYLQARFPETGQTLRTSTRPLVLTDGQVVENVVLRMYRGSAMTGRVLDVYGDPLESAQVQALRLPKSGRGQPQMRGTTMSNDLGEFRVPRLEPGQYLLLVMPQRRPMFGPGLGPVADSAEPEPVPTFYPGVLSIDQAEPIVVERGASVTGVDIRLVAATTALVTGTLLDASAQPLMRGGSIMVRPLVKDVVQMGGFSSFGAPVRPDGTFQVKLPPGEYELEGRAAPIGGQPPSTPWSEQLAMARLSVAGDVSGLTLQIGLGARISGRVVFNGASPIPAVPANTAGAVMWTPDGTGLCRPGRTEVEPDWTFTVEGLFGRCAPRMNAPIPGWMVQSMTTDGKEIDQPITFTPGMHMRDVVVVMTDKPTDVTFHVTDEQGTPTREYVGLLFAADKQKWMDNSGRYIRTLVPPVDVSPGGTRNAPAVLGGLEGGFGGGFRGGSVSGGTFGSAMAIAPAARSERITGLAAGDYYAVAVDDIEAESVRDPELLERLSRDAVRVTLGYGVRAEVNVRRMRLASR